jgi:hypothetical protein
MYFLSFKALFSLIIELEWSLMILLNSVEEPWTSIFNPHQ